MVASKVTLLDVDGIRHAIDISLFQYSLRIYKGTLPTNKWSIVFSDKTRIIVSKVQADYIHNLRDAYNNNTMRDAVRPRRTRK